MSGHLDGPPPGPPDPPYIPGDMGAPSAEEFARRRGSPPHGRDEAENPYRNLGDEWDHAGEAACWDEGFTAGLQKHDGGLWELAFAAGRGAERERIVAALEADYRANVADGADGIYTDGLHDAWRLTERRAKRDDLIKPESGSSEPPKEA